MADTGGSGSSGPGRGPGGGSSNGCSAPGGNGNREGNQDGGQVHEVFGDTNLGMVMLVLLLLHLMQYALKDPCTC